MGAERLGLMAHVIDDFARDGVEVPRMTARLVVLAAGDREEIAADDETLVYVLGEERLVWLDPGDRFVLAGPLRALVGAAR